MTQQTRPTNKARFETGDAPAESDYADLIDSFLSLADSSAQTVTAPVILSDTLGVGVKMSAPTMSANTVNGSAAAFTQAAVSVITVSATASIGIAHLHRIIINVDATAAVSAMTVSAASAARFFEVTVSGVNFWVPLYSQ